MRATNWQRFEGLVIFIAAVIIYLGSGGTFGWWAIAIFFAPDVMCAGYLAGPKIGALAYNAVHVYAFGIGLITVGLFIGLSVLVPLGLLWLAHAGFDRMLGYGLKSQDGFKKTHLGDL